MRFKQADVFCRLNLGKERVRPVSGCANRDATGKGRIDQEKEEILMEQRKEVQKKNILAAAHAITFDRDGVGQEDQARPGQLLPILLAILATLVWGVAA